MPEQVGGDPARSPSRRLIAVVAVALVSMGFVLRLAAALRYPNVFRPDEVFQTIEPAFRMWSGGGVITWEWREGIRSPIFPALLAGVIAVSKAFGATTSVYLTTITLLLSACSSLAIVVNVLIGEKYYGWVGALVCGFIAAISPDMIYFGPKTLTEVQAGNVLIVAAYFGLYARDVEIRQRVGVVPRALGLSLSVCGFLLGLTFSLRFHLAPAIVVIGLASCGRHWRTRWPSLVIGFMSPVIISGLIDKLYWGSWFQSIWLNYSMNVTEHVAQEYGSESYLFFAQKIISSWGPTFIFAAFFSIVGARRAPMLACLAATIVVSHSVIAHKEWSFIYAAFPPIMILVGLGTVDVVLRLKAAVPALWPWTVPFVLIIWSALWISTALSKGFRPLWFQEAGILAAERIVAANDDACGLALDSDAVVWPYAGGDAYIGKPIPIYAFHSVAGARRVLAATNYAIGGSDIADKLPGFRRLQCWPSGDTEICLARAMPEQTCVPDPGFDLNSVRELGRRGTFQGADP